MKLTVEMERVDDDLCRVGITADIEGEEEQAQASMVCVFDDVPYWVNEYLVAIVGFVRDLEELDR